MHYNYHLTQTQKQKTHYALLFDPKMTPERYFKYLS